MLLKAFKHLFIWQVFIRCLLLFRDWHLQVSLFILSAVFMEHSHSAWCYLENQKHGSCTCEAHSLWEKMHFPASGFHEETLQQTLLVSCSTTSPSSGRQNDLPGWFGLNSPLCGAKCSKIPCKWRTIGSALFLRGLNQPKQPAD